MFKNVQVGHEMSEMSTLSIKSKLNRHDALRENGHWGKSKGDNLWGGVHHHGVHFGGAVTSAVPRANSKMDTAGKYMYPTSDPAHTITECTSARRDRDRLGRVTVHEGPSAPPGPKGTISHRQVEWFPRVFTPGALN